MSEERNYFFRSVFRSLGFWVGSKKIKFHNGQFSTSDQKIAGEIRNQMKTRYKNVVVEVNLQPAQKVEPEAEKKK